MEKYIINKYRGFENMEVSISDITILTGENGMGKTSITELIHFIRRIHKMNDIKTMSVGNSNSPFEVFHSFNVSDFKKSEKEYVHGYEYFHFVEKEGMLNIDKYATMRGKDLILFWYKPNKSLHYSIVNNFELMTSKNEIDLIKKQFIKEKSGARLIPWLFPFNRPIEFNAVFSAFVWLSKNLSPKNKKLFENLPELLDHNYFENSNLKGTARESIFDYVSATIHTSVGRIYNIDSRIVKKAKNLNLNMISDKETRINKNLSWIKNNEIVKEFDVFLERSGFPNGIIIDVVETRAGRYNAVYLENNGVPIKITDSGDGLSSVIPFYMGLKKSKFPIIREPETHMHPKAVSEFGSEIFKAKKKIILETHSNYIVDRIRFEQSQTSKKRKIVINTLYYNEKKEKRNEIIVVNDDGRFNGANKYKEFSEDETLKWFK